MKWIDIPPVWLLAFAVAAWWMGQLQPAALAIGGPVLTMIGTALVAIGLILLLLAVFEMREMRTTVIPHQQASHLVTTGIFAHSRNPIYLGDALILAGLALRWDTPVALLLVPLFGWIIVQRFIKPEETRLRDKFGDDFNAYCRETRRWT